MYLLNNHYVLGTVPGEKNENNIFPNLDFQLLLPGLIQKWKDIH